MKIELDNNTTDLLALFISMLPLILITGGLALMMAIHACN